MPGTESELSSMPCENWEAIGEPTAPSGYKYKDPELDDGPVKTLTLKGGRVLTAVLLGKRPGNLGYDLDEFVSQDPVRVRLFTPPGGIMTHCLEFGGSAIVGGKDGSDGKTFKAKDSPAASCP